MTIHHRRFVNFSGDVGEKSAHHPYHQRDVEGGVGEDNGDRFVGNSEHRKQHKHRHHDRNRRRHSCGQEKKEQVFLAGKIEAGENIGGGCADGQ